MLSAPWGPSAQGEAVSESLPAIGKFQEKIGETMAFRS
jgi:hypothetical protein